MKKVNDEANKAVITWSLTDDPKSMITRELEEQIDAVCGHEDFMLVCRAIAGAEDDDPLEATKQLWEKIDSQKLLPAIQYQYLHLLAEKILGNIEVGKHPFADLARNIKKEAHRPKGKPLLLRNLYIALKIEILRKSCSLDAACRHAADDHELAPRTEDTDKKIEAAKHIYKTHKAVIKPLVDSHDRSNIDIGSPDFKRIWGQAAIEMGEDPVELQKQQILHFYRVNSKRDK